jgi:hypothetical protein
MDQTSNITNSHVTTFGADLAAFMKDNTNFLALFKGAEDENGVNWCGDCVRAEPNLKNVIFPKAQEEGLPVLYVNAGTVAE